MDKSSDFIWKTARSHLEYLPDRPDDLAEPEYANLMFCAHCHVRTAPCITLTALIRDSGMWKICQEYSLGNAPSVLPGL